MTRGAVLRLAAAGVLLAVVIHFAHPRSLAEALLRADRDWLIAGFAAAVLSNVFSALRWRALTVWLGASVSRRFAVLTYFKAMALNALLPGAVIGGDVFRAITLRRAGLPSLDAGVSVLLDRSSGLWILLVVGSAAAPFAAQSLHVAQPGPFVLVSLLGAILPPLLLIAPLWLVAGPSTRVLRGRRVAALARVQALMRRANALRQYGLQVAASLLVQALSIGALACCGCALDLDLPSAVWAAASAPVFLMAALPVSFGGWGTREAAAAAVLSIFGVPVEQAVGTAMLYGVFGLAQAALGCVLLTWRPLPLSSAG
ncbi:lysylphosphatidylglycerol synthase transmembrane domain-containing protein [Methyloversatilis sp. XJ19-49]|uniref:lysylphosphatidylglycerol synthase transmembrane domain-containing protein n=1 Tax=Methyloversatilis sp. XJ19-49 TaxID=2963429 RepID=UPI00211C2F14|nr:lysylphosphatidylglycerol synthase transmembrane domain-containing protein [Methyloversatilis sp. XJ19-49]MCQ9378039.1 flippase-like domain-containing protein [Methyloversatilis sp. XJ19-49]